MQRTHKCFRRKQLLDSSAEFPPHEDSSNATTHSTNPTPPTRMFTS